MLGPNTMKRLLIFLAIFFACSSLQALSARYGVYIYYVNSHAKVDIYQGGGGDQLGLSVAEAATFLKTVGIMVAVVTESCEVSDYAPILKAILDRGSAMYLTCFDSGFGGDQMRTWIVRHHKELAEHTAATPH